jgi:hypothetical protein
MARRRKSSKGNGLIGVVVVIGVGVVFAIQFIQQYYAETLTILGLVALGWLGIKLLRWWWLRTAAEKVLTVSGSASSVAVRSPTQVRNPPPAIMPPQIPPAPPSSPNTSLRQSLGRSATKVSSSDPSFHGNVEAQLDDHYSTPDVRIRPLVDPPKTSVRAAADYAAPRWIAPGEAVTIAGVTITGGMFYLGTPSSSSGVQPCFVDSSLNVAKTRSPKNDSPTYYPSYGKITAHQRRGFLQWMADGRFDPSENLSLVFLFFYGLEHRIFKEGVTADAPRLVAEVERLLSIYGRSGSLSRYGGDFIAYARASIRTVSEPDLDFEAIPQEMPLDVKIYIGHKLANGREIQAEDALIWAVSSPGAWRKRWPNDQRDVFEHLWRNRFATRFSDGLRIQATNKKINAVYQPASRSFEAHVRGTFENLPDPSSDTVASVTLKALVEECWTDGGSYISSATRTGSQPSLVAAVLLPAEIWIKRNERLLKTLADHLARVGTGTLILPVTDIFKMAEISVSIPSKTLVRVLKRFSEGLWTLGVGLEPDGNYADTDVSLSSLACLFSIPAPYRGKRYSVPVNVGARAALDAAILCATAADNAEPEIRASIAAAVAEGIDADELERARLGAYASVSKPSPERQPRLLRTISLFSTELRQIAARAAIVGATTDKRMPVQVVRQLEKVHKVLNLPTEELYSALHRMPEGESASMQASDPVDAGFEAVRRELEGFAVPVAPSNAFAIDPERLARAREDTKVVSRILSAVFSETNASENAASPSTTPPANDSPSEAGPFEGLDPSHGALLLTVLDVGALPRSEFERIAKSMKLLADGAIDQINDWAFDRLDGPVIEDGDEIAIQPGLAERVKAMRRDRQ